MKATPVVIAVSAPIGGGKTALARSLADALGTSALLHYDDYERATAQSMDQLAAWLDAGADFECLQAPGFVDDLSSLRSGHPVVERGSGRRIEPQPFIVVDTPLGRADHEAAACIDHLVWIALPLDVALARKLKEFAVLNASSSMAEKSAFIAWLDRYLTFYIATVSKVLALQEQRVRATADQILDGQLATPLLVREVVKVLGIDGLR